jgi:hypothetical protein
MFLKVERGNSETDDTLTLKSVEMSVAPTRMGERKMKDGGNERVVYGISRLTDYDIYLFRRATTGNLQDKLGSHPMTVEGREARSSLCGLPMRNA